MKFDWKSVVKTVAPALGTALGGPMGGMATRAIAGVLLGDEDAAEDAVEQAVKTANPDMFLKLKEADNAFAVKMKELSVDLEKINQEDRSSAREMATKTTLLPQMVLSGIFILGYVAVLYSVFSGGVGINAEDRPMAMILVGMLSAGVTQILNFFFGSSSGSKEKTAILGGK